MEHRITLPEKLNLAKQREKEEKRRPIQVSFSGTGLKVPLGKISRRSTGVQEEEMVEEKEAESVSSK